MTTVDCIDDGRGFALLADEWRGLLADSAVDPLFLSWEWLHTWWRHLGGARRLHLLTVRRAGVLLAVAPLMVRPPQYQRLQPFETLVFLGSGAAGSDYLDLVVRRGAGEVVLGALERHLAARSLDLEFSHGLPGSFAAQLAARLGAAGWSRVDEAIEVCPYIELGGHDWDSYLATLGSAHRYNARRRRRKLEREFDFSVERVSAEASRRLAFAELVRLHRLRRDTLGGSTAFDDDALVRLHDDFSAQALAAGWLRLYLLRLDGAPAAAVYGFRRGARFYFYQSGFDPAYRRHSVGMVALAHTIRAALEEGVAEYDLLHGNESYKYDWAARERALMRHHLYPPHARGTLARGLMGLKQQLKSCRAA